MKAKVLIIFILINSVLFTHFVFPKPDVKIIENGNPGYIITPKPYNPDVVIIQQVTFDPNRISTYIYNKGIFNQDLQLSNTPGLEWPKGSTSLLVSQQDYAYQQ